MDIQLPKSELLRDSFVKTEPRRLGFRFLAQTTPPLRTGQSPPPSPSPPAYPATYRSLLPNYRPPRDSFAKTEPRWLGFRFLAQILPPLSTSQSPPPSLSPPAYPATYRSLLPNYRPPRNSFAKTEPRRLGFHFLAQIPPPSQISQFPPPNPSTSAYPARNRSPLSINDTPHAQFLKAKPLRLSILFSLHFWSIAPIFAFSTIHQLVFAPVYILLLLHMYVHHQYTILGVQFRCVIS